MEAFVERTISTSGNLEYTGQSPPVGSHSMAEGHRSRHVKLSRGVLAYLLLLLAQVHSLAQLLDMQHIFQLCFSF